MYNVNYVNRAGSVRQLPAFTIILTPVGLKHFYTSLNYDL